MEQLDAFQPQQELVGTVDGWKLYDAAAEYRRMGVPNECWHPTYLNRSYEVPKQTQMWRAKWNGSAVKIAIGPCQLEKGVEPC